MARSKRGVQRQIERRVSMLLSSNPNITTKQITQRLKQYSPSTVRKITGQVRHQGGFSASPNLPKKAAEKFEERTRRFIEKKEYERTTHSSFSIGHVVNQDRLSRVADKLGRDPDKAYYLRAKYRDKNGKEKYLQTTIWRTPESAGLLQGFNNKLSAYEVDIIEEIELVEVEGL